VRRPAEPSGQGLVQGFGVDRVDVTHPPVPDVAPALAVLALLSVPVALAGVKGEQRRECGDRHDDDRPGGGMTAADMQGRTIEAGKHIAQTENLARPVRDSVARLLRTAAYEFDRGRAAAPAHVRAPRHHHSGERPGRLPGR
jgi:hypothetical protein